MNPFECPPKDTSMAEEIIASSGNPSISAESAAIDPVSWRTDLTRAVTTENFHDVAMSTVAVVPSSAEEFLLHCIDSKVWLQDSKGRMTHLFGIGLRCPWPARFCVAVYWQRIRATAETRAAGMRGDEPVVQTMFLDRIIQMNGIPYAITDLEIHNAEIQQIRDNMFSLLGNLQFGFCVRVLPRLVRDLYTVGLHEKKMYQPGVLGFRFERLGSEIRSEDRIWFDPKGVAWWEMSQKQKANQAEWVDAELVFELCERFDSK